MVVTRALGVFLLLAACSPGSRDQKHEPPADGAPVEDAYVWPDAAPPPFDAAPLPAMACAPADPGPSCPLPPSSCLDEHYLIYYTNGSCVNDTCTFEEQWMYCSYRCEPFLEPPYGAGCLGGFT